MARLDAGDTDYAAIEAQGHQALREAGMRPDYFAVRDVHTLEVPQGGARERVVLAAARLGKARLIDNLRATPR